MGFCAEVGLQLRVNWSSVGHVAEPTAGNPLPHKTEYTLTRVVLPLVEFIE